VNVAPTNRGLRDYGILTLPLAFAGLPIYLHAPDFYATSRGMATAQLGLILMALRVIDALQDPLIGILSDRFRQFRRSIMLFSIGGLGISLVMLFNPPANWVAGWFAMWLFISTTCYSLLSINLNTLGAIWSGNRYERTRIAGAREKFGLVGVTLGVILPGMMGIWLGKEKSFFILSAVVVILLACSGWRFIYWSRRHPSLFPASAGGGLKGSMSYFARDPAVRGLVGVFMTGALGSALPAVLFLFFVRDRLQAEQWSWVFLLVYFGSAIAGLAFWRDLSRKTGKVQAWGLSIGLAIVSFGLAIPTGPGNLILFGLVCLLTGFALGGDLIFPASLMADLVGDSEETRGRASLGYSWLSFVQKTGLGLAAGGALFVLGSLGFVTGTVNSDAALKGLIVLYAVVPLLLKLTSLALLWKLKPLFDEDYEKDKEMDTGSGGLVVAGGSINRMQKPNEN
jgi:GPH family glycoside/pentoside/hexuronide:cation symporter